MALFPGTDNWRSGMQKVSRAITETMGELVLVTPTVSAGVNFPREPQHGRTAHAKAVYLAPHKSVDLSKQTEAGPVVSTRAPRFEFELQHGLPYQLAQGFWITRACNGEKFEITDVRPDSVSRIICTCVQLGVPGRSTLTTDL